MLEYLQADARTAYMGEIASARDVLIEKLASDGFDLSLLRNPSEESRAVWVAISEGKAKMAAAQEEGRYNARHEVRHGTQPHGEAVLGDAADLLISGKLEHAAPSDLDKTAGAGDQFLKGLFGNLAKRGKPSQWGTGIRNTFSPAAAGSKAAEAAKKMSDAEKFGRGVGNVAAPAAAGMAGMAVLSSVRPENLTADMLREYSRGLLKEARLTAAARLAGKASERLANEKVTRLTGELAARKTKSLKAQNSFLAKVRGKPYKNAVSEEVEGSLKRLQMGEQGAGHELSIAMKKKRKADDVVRGARGKALLGAGGTTAAGATAYNKDD